MLANVLIFVNKLLRINRFQAEIYSPHISLCHKLCSPVFLCEVNELPGLSGKLELPESQWIPDVLPNLFELKLWKYYFQFVNLSSP